MRSGAWRQGHGRNGSGGRGCGFSTVCPLHRYGAAGGTRARLIERATFLFRGGAFQGLATPLPPVYTGSDIL